MHTVVILKILFVMANAAGPFAALFFQSHYSLQGADVAVWVVLVSICYVLGNLAGGLVAGRYDLQRILVGAAGASFMVLLLSVMAGATVYGMYLILCFMFFAGLVVPVFSVLTSLIADDANRIENFGRLHLASNVGGVGLFVIAGIIVDQNTRLLLPYAMLVSGVCLYCSMRFSLPRRGEIFPPPIRSNELREAGISRAVACAFIVYFGLSVLDAQRDYQLPVWLGGVVADHAALFFSALGVLNGVLVIALMRPLLAMSCRFDPAVNLAWAAICYGVGFGAYALFSHPTIIVFFVGFWTVGEILAATYISVIISKACRLSNQAKLFALIPVVQVLARVASIGLAVCLIELYEFDLSWAIFGVVGILFGGAVLLLQHRVNRIG